MHKLLVGGISAGSLAIAAPACASHLVSLIDAPKEQIAIAESFVATGPTTLIVFGGYQIPSFWQAKDISVKGLNTVDLLQPKWTYTPAPVDPLAIQSVASGVVDLQFAGTSVGSYDLFSQSFSTLSGSTYELSFLYIQDYPGANGMKVTVDETLAQVAAESAPPASPTPEPGTWVMMLTGFGMIGLSLRNWLYARQDRSGGA